MSAPSSGSGRGGHHHQQQPPMSGHEMDDADDKVSVSTLTADGHTQLAKMFRKNICDKNFWEIVRTIKKRIDDVELVREGFIAIGDLAFESQLSQKVLGEVGACGTVIYGMKLHAKHLGIAFTGLTAVTALLLNGNADNVVKMTQAGGCEVVVDVLNRHLECAYVALGGALAVHRLAEGHPDNAVVLGTSGAGGLIIRVMRQHMDKQDLVLAGLKALNAMCLHNPDNTRQCIDDGAYEMVIVVLGVHKHDMDIVLMGCVAIVLLAHKRVDPPTPAVSPRPCSSPNSSIQLAQYAQTSVIMSIPSSISVSAVSGVSSSSALTFEDGMLITQQDAVLAVTNAVKAHRHDKSIAAAGSLAIRRIIHNYCRRRDTGESSSRNARMDVDEEEEDEEAYMRRSESKNGGREDRGDKGDSKGAKGTESGDEGGLHMDMDKASISSPRGPLTRTDSAKSMKSDGSQNSAKSLGRLKVSSGPGAGSSYVKSPRRTPSRGEDDDSVGGSSHVSAVSEEDAQIAISLESILALLKKN